MLARRKSCQLLRIGQPSLLRQQQRLKCHHAIFTATTTSNTTTRTRTTKIAAATSTMHFSSFGTCTTHTINVKSNMIPATNDTARKKKLKNNNHDGIPFSPLLFIHQKMTKRTATTIALSDETEQMLSSSSSSSFFSSSQSKNEEGQKCHKKDDENKKSKKEIKEDEQAETASSPMFEQQKQQQQIIMNQNNKNDFENKSASPTPKQTPTPKPNNAQKQKLTYSYFPWRHTHELPPSWIDMESSSSSSQQRKDKNASRFRFDTISYMIANATGYSYLLIPWYRVFFNSWKQELVQSVLWAYKQSITQIMSKLYQIPIEKIAIQNNNSDDDGEQCNDDDNSGGAVDITQINFDTSDFIDNHNKEGNTNTKYSDKTEKEQNNNSKPTTNKTTDNNSSIADGDDDNCSFVSSEGLLSELNTMIDQKLLDLYETYYDNIRTEYPHIHIKIQTKPTDAYLYKLHALPHLSRKMINDDPSVLDKYNAYMYGADNHRRSQLSKVNTINDDEDVDGSNHNKEGKDHPKTQQPKKALHHAFRDYCLKKYGTTETTIFAEIVISCDELFCITDTKTGEIVRGSNEMQNNILHTVRLEKVQSMTPESSSFELGDWVITDIDYLLEGNKWYQSKHNEGWYMDG